MWRKLLKFYYRLKVWLTPFRGECTDIPDPRDYLAGFPKSDLLPESVNHLEKAEMLGAIFIPQSKNSCTSYSRGNAVKIQNTINNGIVAEYNSETLWNAQVEAGHADGSYGATLQSALEGHRKNPQGYPDGAYGRVQPSRDSLETKIEKAKAWLARGRVLYTGVYWTGNTWNNLKSTGIYKKDSGDYKGAHAILIIGYNENGFIAFEPLLYEFGGGDKGVFTIPFNEIESLMSIYVISDLKDKRFTK